MNHLEEGPGIRCLRRCPPPPPAVFLGHRGRWVGTGAGRRSQLRGVRILRFAVLCILIVTFAFWPWAASQQHYDPHFSQAGRLSAALESRSWASTETGSTPGSRANPSVESMPGREAAPVTTGWRFRGRWDIEYRDRLYTYSHPCTTSEPGPRDVGLISRAAALLPGVRGLPAPQAKDRVLTGAGSVKFYLLKHKVMTVKHVREPQGFSLNKQNPY